LHAAVRLTSPEADLPVTLPTASPETASATTVVDSSNPAPAAAADVVDTATAPLPSTERRHETPWPWYRREPWLAVVLAAFVPIAVGFATPQEFHVLLISVSALLVIVSTAMLIRQGPFRAHPRPEATRRKAARGAARHVDA
jgi:hypothetical protein